MAGKMIFGHGGLPFPSISSWSHLAFPGSTDLNPSLTCHFSSDYEIEKHHCEEDHDEDSTDDPPSRSGGNHYHIGEGEHHTSADDDDCGQQTALVCNGRCG